MPTAPKPIRVLVIDDSAVVRGLLTRELNREPDIEVCGAAPDPYVARDKVVELRPDVITLDVEMPRMDGITFLGHLMRSMPTPTVVLSSLAASGAQTSLDALAAGAVDVMCKPGSALSVEGCARELARKIRTAAKARVFARTARPAAAARAPAALSATTNRVIAIGASTGGVQALTAVLTQFPANAPGTVIVQHMPAAFTANFASRLNGMCRVTVREARPGDSVVPGTVLLAPGDRHMTLTRSGARYEVALNDGPPVHHQRPAVDVLFHSVAKIAGANAVGAVLTGMGDDGAAGLLAMRRAGARTMAQDEASSIVYGMPMEAMRCGAAERQVSLEQVASALLADAAAPQLAA